MVYFFDTWKYWIHIAFFQSQTIEGFEVRIEKGCGKKSELQSKLLPNTTDSNYNADRKCWTRNLYEKEIFTTSQSDVTTDDEVPSQLIVSLGIKDVDVSSYKLARQAELCICDGWFCNGSINLYVSYLCIFIAVLNVLLQ